jgi:hypothetical protein
MRLDGQVGGWNNWVTSGTVYVDDGRRAGRCRLLFRQPKSRENIPIAAEILTSFRYPWSKRMGALERFDTSSGHIHD